MKCPECGFEVVPGKKFCRNCGVALTAAVPPIQTAAGKFLCGNCKTEVTSHDELCPHCSVPIAFEQKTNLLRFISGRLPTTLLIGCLVAILGVGYVVIQRIKEKRRQNAVVVAPQSVKPQSVPQIVSPELPPTEPVEVTTPPSTTNPKQIRSHHPPKVHPQSVGTTATGGTVEEKTEQVASAPPPPPPAPPKPVYSGPKTGVLLWSGFLEKGSLVTIDGSQASMGTVYYILPGVPVDISIEGKDVDLVAGPGLQNGWRGLTLRSKVKRHMVVTITWKVAQ